MHCDADADFSFVRLAVLTANVVEFLQSNREQNEQRSSKPNAGRAHQENHSHDGAEIDQRLNEGMSSNERLGRPEEIKRRRGPKPVAS